MYESLQHDVIANPELERIPKNSKAPPSLQMMRNDHILVSVSYHEWDARGRPPGITIRRSSCIFQRHCRVGSRPVVEPTKHPCHPLPVLPMCPSPRAATCESLSIPFIERRVHDPPLQIAMDLQTLGKSHQRDFPLGIPGAKGTRYGLHS